MLEITQFCLTVSKWKIHYVGEFTTDKTIKKEV